MLDLGSEEHAIKILTAAVKTLDMTDKQILAACKPKLEYYATKTKTEQRSCLWCDYSTGDGSIYRPIYLPEPIIQLEAHYMEKHAF